MVSKQAAVIYEEDFMSYLAKNTRTTIIPSLSYRNAPAAIEWLCHTFGFEQNLVAQNEDGTIAHAELSFGNGMIMLYSTLEKGKETAWHRLTKHPDEVGGLETQSTNIIVSDADEIYRRVKAAGAEIVLEIRDSVMGSRSFSCRDLEGRLWNFSTYDPWSSDEVS